MPAFIIIKTQEGRLILPHVFFSRNYPLLYLPGLFVASSSVSSSQHSLCCVTPAYPGCFFPTRTGARETPGLIRPGSCPQGPRPSWGSMHIGTVTRIPGNADQQAPGVLRSWPWGAQGEVPKDQQRGGLCLPEPDSSCANSFCKMHVGLHHSICPAQFALASPQSQAFILSSLFPSLWLPRPHASDYRSSVQTKPQGSVKTEHERK